MGSWITSCDWVWQLVITFLVLADLSGSFKLNGVSGESFHSNVNMRKSSKASKILQGSRLSSSHLFEDFVHVADHHGSSPGKRERKLGQPFENASSRREVEALIAFKQSVTSDPLGALDSWHENDTHPCSWMGVGCSPFSTNAVEVNLSSLQLVGVVPQMVGFLNFLVHVDLSDNFLSGSIPDSIVNCSMLSYVNISFNQVKGEIPSKIGELSYLQAFDARGNNITGVIPESVGNCSLLKYLLLGSNSLQGTIPLGIGQMSSLIYLILNENFLSGTVPSGMGNCSSLSHVYTDENFKLGGELPEELSQLRNMQVFHVDKCNFVGPFPAWVSNLTYLVDFDLSKNSFSGEIPEDIGQLSLHLKFLVLNSNQLTGPIPLAIVNCTSLVWLELQDNQMTGDVPSDIGLLGYLETLALEANNFTGVIPASISNCSALQWLELGENPMSRQTIPSWIASLAGLEVIWLSQMNLYGGIPAGLGQLSHLQHIAMDRNYLGGVIPKSLGNFSFLQSMGLYDNQLVGDIPSEITENLTSLTALFLEYNHFAGSIPDFSNLNELEIFDIGDNLLAGNIDSNIGVGAPQLRKFSIDNNNFSGPMPEGIGNFSNLQSLSLASNSFTRSIPQMWGNLTDLGLLNLQVNMLEGMIPVTLMSCSHLSTLVLEFNRFKGSIPQEIGQLRNLEQLYLDNNLLSGTIPSAFANFTKMGILDLSYNRLSGTLPGDALSMMASSLFSLDLRHNFISGPWPPEFNVMTNLQHLDMSRNSLFGPMLPGLRQCIGLTHLDVSLNNLSGTIPQDLGLLQHLEFFNASFNDFEGPVPEVGVFQTSNITKDSFLGNPKLCGSAILVSHQCPRPSSPNPTQQSSCRSFKCEHIWIPVTCAIAIFILSLLGGGCFLWWRIFFCRKMELEREDVVMELSFQERIVLSEQQLMRMVSGGEDNVIGTGAKSIVYKGFLQSGEMFAVKVLRDDVSIDHDEVDSSAKNELLREVHTLAKLRHKNIIKVRGLCITPNIKALILEYMPNGSLHDNLYSEDNSHLCHQMRFKIILGIAESLVYLHHSFHESIIHRDLKPSNILLGIDLQPKLADFGISKFARHTKSTGEDLEASASTFCGTLGYMAPEYATQSRISTKGDVYSFGTILLEVLTRRNPTSEECFGANGGLVEYVMESFRDRSFEVLDITLIIEGRDNAVAKDQMMLLLRVGLLCTRSTPKERPSMKDVLEMLKQIKDIEAENVPLRTIDELAHDISGWRSPGPLGPIQTETVLGDLNFST